MLALHNFAGAVFYGVVWFVVPIVIAQETVSAGIMDVGLGVFDFAVVVAVDEQGRLLLVRQFRHAVNQYTLEPPAGHVDAGETPEQSARKDALAGEIATLEAEQRVHRAERHADVQRLVGAVADGGAGGIAAKVEAHEGRDEPLRACGCGGVAQAAADQILGRVTPCCPWYLPPRSL